MRLNADIPADLTFEQFKALAMREPDLKGDWLYDNTGKLLDRTITHWVDSDGVDSIYFGPTHEPRFHRGDIVEVWGGDKKVNLAVVLHEPNPLEWYWERYQRHGADYYFDSSDEEMYYLFEGPGTMHHVHACTVALMTPRFPISDDIRAFFEHCLECADEVDCEKVYHSAYFSDTEAGLLGENDICLLYDRASGRHRLSYVVDNHILSENYHRMMLPGTPDDAQLGRLKSFFSGVMYGKPRLWYLIRNWNECCRFDGLEPELPPDTTIDQLLS